MDVFVECDASPGVFSDEMVVQVAGREFLVPKDHVESNGGHHASLRAKMAPDGEWVVLPTAYSDVVSKGQVTLLRR